jgi:hypothetical protein
VPCAWCGMMRKSKGHIIYTPLSDATPDSDLDALAAVYAFVLEAHAKKKAATPSGPENGVKENHHVHTRESIPR